MAHTVFICHSSKDKHVANAACAALEAQRIPCWIAPRDVLGGAEYMQEIVDALSTCQIVLLIFSSTANDSPQVRREIERAVSKEKIIVPFRIEDVLPTRSLEFALSNTHWLDAISPPMEGRLADMCRTVLKLIERQAPGDPLFQQPKPSVPPANPYVPAPPASTNRSPALWISAAVCFVALVAGGAFAYVKSHAATPVVPSGPAPIVNNTPVEPGKPATTIQPSQNSGASRVADTHGMKVVVAPAAPRPILVSPPIATGPNSVMPSGPPAMSQAQKDQLDELELTLTELSSRATADNASLNTMQRSLQASGLNLRGDIAGKQASLNSSLAHARQALGARDVDRASKFTTQAQNDLTALDSFLGR